MVYLYVQLLNPFFPAQKWLLQLQVVSKNAKVGLNRVDALEKASHALFEDVSAVETVEGRMRSCVA